MRAQESNSNQSKSSEGGNVDDADLEGEEPIVDPENLNRIKASVKKVQKEIQIIEDPKLKSEEK